MATRRKKKASKTQQSTSAAKGKTAAKRKVGPTPSPAKKSAKAKRSGATAKRAKTKSAKTKRTKIKAPKTATTKSAKTKAPKAKKTPAKAPKTAPVAASNGKGKAASKGKASAKTKPAAKAAKAPKSDTTYLGRADSMNASISLLLIDGAAAAEAWEGVDPDDFDAIEKTATKLGALGGGLDNGEAKSFTLGGTGGVGFQLSVGQGIAHVFRTNGRLVIAEGFVDDVENPDFLAWVAGAPSAAASDGGTLEVKSGVLALLLPGGAYEDLPSRVKQTLDASRAARIGSDAPGLLIKMDPARYRLLIEPETTEAFGQAARAVLERT